MSRPSGPAIVAAAFTRPTALGRLLGSLARARYPDDVEVPLVISIDHGGDPLVAVTAKTFPWPHGPKLVIVHPANLGLRAHILSCGDLTERFGAVIVLEDDLLVAPHFYAYARAALEFYDADDRIGGIALYSYRLNEFNNLAFTPLSDGSDTYFLQVAASWGQAWTARQWRAFRTWYARQTDRPILEADGVPRQLEAWSAQSWKKYYIKYLVTTDRFFAYPHAALSTNSAKPGSHTKREVNIYQVPLDMGPRDWRFSTLDESLSVYDVYHELKPAALKRLRPDLADGDFDVDLSGLKPASALTRPELVSSRPCSAPRLRFGMEMVPLEANLAYGVEGDMFSVGPRAAFGAMPEARKLAVVRHLNNFAYWNKYFFQMLKPIQTRVQILRKRIKRTPSPATA